MCSPCSARPWAAAYLPPAKAQEILRKSELVKRTEDTKVDIEEITNELKKVRKKGYCLIINELNEDEASLAVPILDHNSNPVAAISVSSGVYRLSQPENEAQVASAVKAAGTRISSMLGYYPRPH